MKWFLVGISYHYPEDLKLWNEGVMEDFEASTGIFIEAPTKREAIEWGEMVARELHAQENPEDSKSWDDYSHHCWIEDDIEASGWEHCLAFFQRVRYGEMPALGKMNTKAYVAWQRENKHKG